jgi:hypothetical protein
MLTEPWQHNQPAQSQPVTKRMTLYYMFAPHNATLFEVPNPSKDVADHFPLRRSMFPKHEHRKMQFGS